MKARFSIVMLSVLRAINVGQNLSISVGQALLDSFGTRINCIFPNNYQTSNCFPCCFFIPVAEFSGILLFLSECVSFPVNMFGVSSALVSCCVCLFQLLGQHVLGQHVRKVMLGYLGLPKTLPGGIISRFAMFSTAYMYSVESF